MNPPASAKNATRRHGVTNTARSQDPRGSGTANGHDKTSFDDRPPTDVLDQQADREATAKPIEPPRQNSKPPLSGKVDFGAHVALEAAAISAGRRIVAAVMRYGPRGPLDMPPVVMPTNELVTVATVAHEAWNAGRRGWEEVVGFAMERTPDEAAQDAIRASIAGIAEEVTERPEVFERAAGIVMEYHRARSKQHLAWRLKGALESGDDTDAILAEIASLESGGHPEADNVLAKQFAARAFNFASQPAKPRPVFMIGGKECCTEGNLTNIQAPPKAGKTAGVESLIAAALNGNRTGPDTLGFSAENPKGHALIHIDTEQSAFDHDALVRRALRRARVESPPPWLLSFALVDLSVADRRKAAALIMRQAQRDHGGIFAVLIDGVADLCFDPNDSAEAFELVHSLHSLAAAHSTVIVTVLHENPGSESGKTRGHLGSELERKAETNLRLAKDKNGVTTIWAEKARHLYLPKDQGACFAWNDQAQMHTSCGTAGELKQAASRDKAIDEAERAFNGSATLRHAALVAAIGEALDLQEKASKNRVKTWRENGIISKDDAGNYHLSTP
ncbi:MAG: hypothetical protein WCK77_22865 [Verrucomicrobiota bacterium]